MEIWLDVDKEGHVDREVVEVARNFRWASGPKVIHIQEKHTGIAGQWIGSWRPDLSSDSLGLILEDDLTLSPYAYRWVRKAHQAFGGRSDILGYTLQSEEVFQGRTMVVPLDAPSGSAAFLYTLIGTWGFAPHPARWREFQDWFYKARKDRKFSPYVRGIEPTRWYKMFELEHKEDNMWEMWAIYYSHVNGLYTVYSNLNRYNRDNVSCLAVNRKELGLHQPTKGQEITQCLLRRWDESFVDFQAHDLPRYNVKGVNRKYYLG